MATKLLKLRMGVADDPTALQPTLNDCLEALLQQAPMLMGDVVNGLLLASLPTSAQKVAIFLKGDNKAAIESLNKNTRHVCKTYLEELTKIVYHGGGKEVQHTAVRFEDLQLFGDAELDTSIEVARAQQEVSSAVDDVLPLLDSLISTLLGWRTIQPGLNPVRPEVFVRALQTTLSEYVPDNGVREALIAPAAGLMGVNLRKLYRELSDWLASTGVEPAVPIGGRVTKGSGASGASVNESVAKTLLTLDKLRKLLAGEFDQPKGRADFMHTVPASMALLQEMKGVDQLVKRLETKRPAATPAPETLEERQQIESDAPPAQHLGKQLGSEVVRLMFDNLGNDQRLLTPLRGQLKDMEPAILRLAEEDSRFFSDRNHPARQLLDRITQRSLAFAAEDDPGWPRFMKTVQESSKWLDSKVIDADTFGELLDHLQTEWSTQDQTLKQKREEAARALMHAEQRNLLSQKLSAEFATQLEGLEVADFVSDFLKGSWAQVVAESQLSCADGSDDPYGYRAMVDDLMWSVQRATSQRGRTRRLVQMIPALLAKLREGLARIDYPPELTQRFFDNLITIHRAAVQDGHDPEVAAAAEAAESEPSRFDMDAAEAAMWMAQNEMADSGYMEVDSFLPPEAAAEIDAAAEAEAKQQMAADSMLQAAAEADSAPAPLEPVGAGELRTGTWVELIVEKKWTRMQLTWASPHGTLFMFTSISGTAHSMSKRTLERLRADGLIRVVADRNVVDEALDNVAKAALRNSLSGKS